MNTSRRFQVYLIGSLIGIVCVYFLFQGANTTPWLPNERVLLRLRETLKVDQHMKCLMDCHNVQKHDLGTLLLHGNVEFSESQTAGDHLTYIVLSENAVGEEIRWVFECHPNDAYASAATFPGRECSCDNP